MSHYTFPFDTCEKPNINGIAQPYSALFNLINCVIIFYFLLKTEKKYTFILLFSILCFELFHVFSHIIHIPGSLQTNITHFLTYFINIAFFYLFYCFTKKMPSYAFVLYLLALVCFDIYSLFYLSIVFYIISQAIIMISLFLFYLPLLPESIQKAIYPIIFFIVLIIFLFLNEKYNCEKMMSYCPDFPYHILIEILGIVLFYIICSNFYKL
jgi:hypothetical protein